jgi:hypothetical protein
MGGDNGFKACERIGNQGVAGCDRSPAPSKLSFMKITFSGVYRDRMPRHIRMAATGYSTQKPIKVRF